MTCEDKLALVNNKVNTVEDDIDLIEGVLIDLLTKVHIDKRRQLLANMTQNIISKTTNKVGNEGYVEP